jgi:hypothetical protein
LLDNADQAGAIGEISMVQEEFNIGIVSIPVEVIYPISIEERCAPLNSMDDIPLAKEKFRKICPILPCDSGN